MRKLFLLTSALVLFVMMSPDLYGQSKKYDPEHGYDAVSNLEIGLGATLSNQIFTNKEMNFGMNVMLAKRVKSFSRIRGLAEINGFRNSGTFDRQGKVLFGATLDFLPFYMFADFGAVYNKSNEIKLGLAADAGVGLKFKLGEYAGLYAEAGLDRWQKDKGWMSNGLFRLGVTIEPGITDDDRHAINQKEYQPKLIQELSLENKAKNEQIRDFNKTLDTMNRTLTAANNMINKLRKEIVKCEEEKDKNCKEGTYFDIHFGYASVVLEEIEYDRLITIAEIMSQNSDYYYLESYCSNDGQDDTNMALAIERGNKVLDVLSKLGVDETRMLVVAKGKTVSYGDGQGSQNRFVRIIKR